jgi:hypothetical protein
VILGHMVPTGTGFRDHYRTRVKKNIDFGEIGSGAGFSPATVSADMDALFSGSLTQSEDALGAALAAVTRGAATALAEPAPSKVLPATALDDDDDDEDDDEELPAED